MVFLHIKAPDGELVPLERGDTVFLEFPETTAQGGSVVCWGFLRDFVPLFFKGGADKRILNARGRTRRQLERDLVGHLMFLGFAVKKNGRSPNGRKSYFLLE